MSYSRTADDFDHARDLAKHEPRHDDHPVLGKFTEPPRQPSPRPDLPEPSVLAIECALLVKHNDIKLQLAAQLIEEFARAEAARGRLEAVAAGAGA